MQRIKFGKIIFKTKKGEMRKIKGNDTWHEGGHAKVAMHREFPSRPILEEHFCWNALREANIWPFELVTAFC